MRKSGSIGIALCAVLLTACAAPYSTRTPAPRVAAPGAAATVTGLTAEQSARIRAFIRNDRPAVDRGRGRGRGGNLPPGIARNLERGKPLPPGIARTYLPRSLLSTLPPLDSALEYVVIAGKLLIVEVATQIVREVLLDALAV